MSPDKILTQHHSYHPHHHKENYLLTHSLQPMLEKGDFTHAKEIIANPQIKTKAVKTAILACAVQTSSPHQVRELIAPLTKELEGIRTNAKTKEELFAQYQKSEFFQILTAISDDVINKVQEIKDDPELMEDFANASEVGSIVVDCVQFGLDPTGLNALRLTTNIAAAILSDIEIKDNEGLTILLQTIGELAQFTSFILDFVAPDISTIMTVGAIILESGILEDIEDWFEDLSNDDEDKKEDDDEKDIAKENTGVDGAVAEEVFVFLKEEITQTVHSLTSIKDKTGGLFNKSQQSELTQSEKSINSDPKAIKKAFVEALTSKLPDKEKREFLNKAKQIADNKGFKKSLAQQREENKNKMVSSLSANSSQIKSKL